MKKKEDVIEFCTNYTYSDGMLCFLSMALDRFHDGPVTEVKCFQKITNK